MAPSKQKEKNSQERKVAKKKPKKSKKNKPNIPKQERLKWRQGWKALKQYHQEKGNCDFSSKLERKENLVLYKFVKKQRRRWKKQTLKGKRKKKLDSIGFAWEKRPRKTSGKRPRSFYDGDISEGTKKDAKSARTLETADTTKDLSSCASQSGYETVPEPSISEVALPQRSDDRVSSSKSEAGNHAKHIEESKKVEKMKPKKPPVRVECAEQKQKQKHALVTQAEEESDDKSTSSGESDSDSSDSMYVVNGVFSEGLEEDSEEEQEKDDDEDDGTSSDETTKRSGGPAKNKPNAYNEKQWFQQYEKVKALKQDGTSLTVSRDRALQRWVAKQRAKYAGKYGGLREDRKALLNKINFIWESKEETRQQKWMEQYEKLKKFYSEDHGHLMSVPHKETALLKWMSRQRTAIKVGALSENQKEMLDKINFVWHGRAAAKRPPKSQKETEEVTMAVHGHCCVPKHNTQLNDLMDQQRKLYRENKISEQRKKGLEDLGFVRNAKKAPLERKTCTSNQEPQNASPSSHSPPATVTEDGTSIISCHNFVSERNKVWMIMYQKLIQFFKDFQHFSVPKEGKFKALARWCQRQRALKRGNGLKEDRLKLLDDIHFVWDGHVAREAAKAIKTPQNSPKVVPITTSEGQIKIAPVEIGQDVSDNVQGQMRGETRRRKPRSLKRRAEKAKAVPIARRTRSARVMLPIRKNLSKMI